MLLTNLQKSTGMLLWVLFIAAMNACTTSGKLAQELRLPGVKLEDQPKHLLKVASKHAMEVCMINLARRFNSHIKGLVQTYLSNQELSQKEAESINKMVSAYENWTAINLGPVIPVSVFLKDEGDGIVEVSVSVAYNVDENLERLREKTISKLEEDTDIAREKLDRFLSPSRFNKFQNN